MAVDVQPSGLDIRDEQARLGGAHADLYEAVITLQAKLDLLPPAVRSRDSLSIRSDTERQQAIALVRRYRDLPGGERSLRPALLNAVAKLELATGACEAARLDFLEAAGLLEDPSAKGEAFLNAYKAALERQNYDDGFQALIAAIKADGRRFAPFPVGKYHPLKILGAGGFGVAFLCKHKYLDANVVVKAFTGEELDRPVEQVFAEARALQQVQHPAIARLQDCGYADPAAGTRPYLVMDYFDGVTLDQYVGQHGPLAERDLRAVARQMAEGLKAAHDKGILHRDVKPANVLVRRDGKGWHVQFIDFGLALRQDRAVELTARHRQTLIGSALAGTLDYSAPEQMGKLPGVGVSPRSDVYAFGKTCCFALFQTTQPLRKHWQSIPEGLAGLLENCLQEQPADRPADFAAVLAALDDLDVVAGPDGSTVPDEVKLLPLNGERTPADPEPEPVAAVETVEEIPVAKVARPARREPVYVAPVAARPRPADERPARRSRAADRDYDDEDRDEGSGGPPVWVWVAGGGAACVALLAAVLVMILWRPAAKPDNDPDTTANNPPASQPMTQVAGNPTAPVRPAGPADPPPAGDNVEVINDGPPDPTVPPRGNPGAAAAGGGFPNPAGRFPPAGGDFIPGQVDDKTIAVHVHILNNKGITVKAVAERLKALVDDPNNCTLQVTGQETVGVLRIGPVADRDAFRKKIRFGQVAPLGDRDLVIRFFNNDSLPGGATAPAGQPKADDDIAQALDDLKSDNLFTRKGAAQKLKGMPVDAKRQSEVAKALENVFKKDTDHFTRIEACAAAGVWGNADTANELARIVTTDKDVFVRRAALDALGELKIIQQPQAQALAAGFIDFHTRQNATEAFKKIGSPAEKAVHPILTHSDLFTRRDACNLLKEIGTRESIPVLQAFLRRERELFPRQAAAEALQALLALPPAKKDKDPKDKKDKTDKPPT
jgi:serine/threonine protein kinase